MMDLKGFFKHLLSVTNRSAGQYDIKPLKKAADEMDAFLVVSDSNAKIKFPKCERDNIKTLFNFVCGTVGYSKPVIFDNDSMRLLAGFYIEKHGDL